MLMIGLRTIWGRFRKTPRKIFWRNFRNFKNNIQSKLEEEILVIEENHLKIPEKHWFLADELLLISLFFKNLKSKI